MPESFRAVTVLNQIGVIFSAMWAVSGFLFSFHPLMPKLALIAAIATGLLLLAHRLLSEGHTRISSIFMFVGGIGAFPAGIPSIIASWIARNIDRWQRHERDHRVRCLKCGYDLRGLTLPRCPECGCAIGFDKTFAELGIPEDEIRERAFQPPSERG